MRCPAFGLHCQPRPWHQTDLTRGQAGNTRRTPDSRPLYYDPRIVLVVRRPSVTTPRGPEWMLRLPPSFAKVRPFRHPGRYQVPQPPVVHPVVRVHRGSVEGFATEQVGPGPRQLLPLGSDAVVDRRSLSYPIQVLGRDGFHLVRGLLPDRFPKSL